MRHFNLVKSLTRVINTTTLPFREGLGLGRLILCLSLATLGVESAWGTYYAEAIAEKSNASTGDGTVYGSGKQKGDKGNPVSCSINATPDEKSVFCGWSMSDNSRVYFATTANTSVQVNASSSDGKTNSKNYYAVFDHVFSQALANVADGGGGKIYVAQNDMSIDNVPNWFDTDQTAVVNLAKKTYYWYAKPNSGYAFVGWLPNTTGTNYVSQNAKYSEEITAASTTESSPTQKTYYAKFAALPSFYFKAQADKNGIGAVYASFTDGSFTKTSDIKSELGTSLTQTQSTGTYTAYFKAEETDAAYHFAGWYTDAECTEANRVSTNLSYSEQISGSTATTEAGAKTIIRYAKFVQELTPEVTANYSSSPKAMFVDDEISSAFSFLNTSEIGKGLSVVSSNDNIITYDAVNNKVIAKNEGSATLTFTQTKQDIIKAGEFSFTFNVSKIANTLTAAETHTMKVDETWNNVYSSKNSDGTITTESTDASIAYFDVTNNKIVAPNSSAKSFNSKEVTITISQAATYKYTEAEKKIKVTINKWDNHISINGTQDSYQTSCFMDSYAQISSLTATNTDYIGSPFSNVQTSGNDIATFYQDDKVVNSTHNLGTATWTISQPENYKYKATNATLTVKVVTQAEATDCYVLNDESEHSFSTNFTDFGGHFDTPLAINGPACQLTFEAKKDKAGANQFVAQYSIDNGNNWTDVNMPDLSDSYQKPFGPFNIPDNATHIRFGAKTGGTLSKYYRNVRVSRKTYLNAANVEITETSSHNPVHPNEVGVGTLTINHSLANGGNLKVKWDNDKFKIDGKTAAQGIDLGDLGCSTGVSNLPISYTSAEAGTHTANVVIYNNVYRATATITGTTIKRDQNIQWNTDIMIVGQTEANAAQTTSIINGVVTYESDNTEIIQVKEDDNGQLTILEARQPGTANITAFSAGNEEYNDAQSTKEITVTDKQIQYITWNQSLMGLKMGDADVPLNASAYQPDSLNCLTGGQRPITYSSANTAVVEIVSGNKLRIKGIGVTTVTASQAGGTDGDGHDFIAVTAEKKVVVRDPNAPCETYIYEQTSEVEFDLSWIATAHQTKTYEIDFHGQEPGFINFDYKGEVHTVWPIDYYAGTLSIEQYVNNQWVEVRNFGKPGTSGYTNTGDIALDRKATKIRVKAADGMGYMYFKDCRITLARYLEGSKLSKFETKVGSPLTKTLTVKYSNISGPVTFTLSENSNFSLSKESIEGECGGYGSTTIDITYTPTQEAIGESATLTLADDIQKTQITLEGNATVTPLHINWDIPDNNTCYTIQSVNLSATALTDLNVEIPNFVWFNLAQNSTTGILTGNTLTFDKAGNANVVAQTIGDPRYTPAQNVFKNWTVNLTPTQITTTPTLPTEIISGTAISDVTLTGGEVKNTINNQAVEGTFTVTDGDLVNVGEQTLTITFTPNNTDMYEGCTTTIVANVVQRTPTAEEVGTPSAADVYYGQAIGESVLTGTGTLAGKWIWTDYQKDEKKEIGTYNSLQVQFIPDDNNVKSVEATVTLNVITPVDLEFVGTIDNTWDNSQNWKPVMQPESQMRIIVSAPLVIETAVSVAGVKINSNGKVIVSPTGGLTVGEKGMINDNAENLIIQSTHEGQGYLRISPEYTGVMPKATVQLATRSTLDNGANKDATWQYVGIPTATQSFEVDYITWLYEWSEPNGWVNLKNATQPVTLEAWKGYAVTQYGQPTYEWKGQLLREDKTIELTCTTTGSGMNGDNLFANSYSSPIDVKRFTEDDFEGTLDKTFYIFNSGSWNQWNDNKGEMVKSGTMSSTNPGQYIGIPALSAVYLEDNLTMIAPMQGVYVYTETGGAKIKLNYTKHVWQASSTKGEMNLPLRAPQDNGNIDALVSEEMRMRDSIARVDREKCEALSHRIRISATSENSGADFLYVLEEENFTHGYDNGYEAPKIMADAEGVLNIYTNEAEAGLMSVAATNDVNEMFIGFNAGEDVNYELYITSVIGDDLELMDMQTGDRFALKDSVSYAFAATPNSEDPYRFRIFKSETKPVVPTGWTGLGDKAKIWYNKQTLYISDAASNSTASIYTAAGELLEQVTFNHNTTISTADIPEGVYTVRVEDSVLKIFVKH